MRARAATLLLAALLALTPSLGQARVHRRSVGPVILDLGPLPSPPVAPGPPVPAADDVVTPSTPQNDTAPESLEVIAAPLAAEPVYPTYSQPLSPLVQTLNAQTDAPVEDRAAMITPPPASSVAFLVAYFHPTFAEDDALLAPRPIESTPAPAPQTSDPPKSDPPLPLLRGAMIWIWRLLFLSGFGAILLLAQRYRSRIGAKTPKTSKQPDAKETTNVLESAIARISRVTRPTPAPAVDSLSLLNGKPPAMEPRLSAPKDLGLIEPGAAKPLRTPTGSS